MAFVMVLSWCRQIFLRFYLGQKLENFLRGHVAAFDAMERDSQSPFSSDNLKTAVLERQGDAIRFHPTFLELSAHYRFRTPPGRSSARGNEKGRVERAHIRYVRESFFAGRTWQDLDDLNAQAEQWCQGISADRRCPGDSQLSVREAFEQEHPRLLALPDTAFPTDEPAQVCARKYPYVRFDRNDYSIPHTHLQKPLTALADLKRVRILSGTDVIATHPRSFDKGRQIEDESHINALWLSKSKARLHRGQDRLAQASPLVETLLQQAGERGHVLKTTVNLLLELLDDYGREAFHEALTEALQQQSPYPEAVRQILERWRHERQQPPPLAVAVPEKARHYSVRPARLADYDDLDHGRGTMPHDRTMND
jgi:hypothetical protein